MKAHIKRIIKSFLSRNEAQILTYHSISDQSLPFPMWTQLPEELFEAHIRFISNNFNCVSLSSLQQQLQTKKISKRTIVVTFDDGFANNYTRALPILKKYNVPATIFVTTDYIDQANLIWSDAIAASLALTNNSIIRFDDKNLPLTTIDDKSLAYRHIVNKLKKYHPNEINNFVNSIMSELDITNEIIANSSLYDNFRCLTKNELIDMANSGIFEIGAHTTSHRILARLSQEEVIYEVTESKSALENILKENDYTINYFAYPNGGKDDFTSTHRDILINAGYKLILTSINGTVTTKSDPFKLNRIGISGDCTSTALNFYLHGGVALQKRITISQLISGLFTGQVNT